MTALTDQLARLRADLAAATPGPLHSEGAFVGVGAEIVVAAHWDIAGGGTKAAYANARAHVGAVNAAPMMLDVVEAAAKYVEADRRYLAKLDNDDDDCEKAFNDSEDARANLFAALDRAEAEAAARKEPT